MGCKVSTTSSRPVWQNRRCWKNENKAFHWKYLRIFNYFRKTESIEDVFGRQVNRICCRVGEVLQRRKKKIYCICWTYNTILEKCSLPVHGTWWILVRSKNFSLRHNWQLWTPEKLAPWTWCHRMSRFVTFCPFRIASDYENLKNPSLKL